MQKIETTGASQRVSSNGMGEWEAWYVCHKCGEEFANSRELCKEEKMAREQSDLKFDKQRRRYCIICGYKITTKEPVPENKYIECLNHQIDQLELKQRDHVAEIKKLQKDLYSLLKEYNSSLRDDMDMADAERVAIEEGWIAARKNRKKPEKTA